MRFVGVTQRALPPTEFGEVRDALDIRWPAFLAACDLAGVPLPNVSDIALETVVGLAPAGIVLTGGDDLAAYGGKCPQRDLTEITLLHWALSRNVPVIGVCRGMQVILHAFEVALSPVDGHAGVRHRVVGEGWERTVNSYHRWAATSIEEPLDVVARHGPVIEAIRHRKAPVVGMMWHPERERVPNPRDIALFREILLDER
ncbi:gamma-glutamyl-gamma-aminobutyrate hydrolase [Streptomyces sp. F001]|uniref:gamma-glutamyl-gamma-aminobutyrate hydrolase family protein n=1 Tax=Streptomyces sp. F001 TaxID=1510026 RepID=UPI00101E538B|nr:gamma-glutamyl-gamma-aminobutyrate hydrolase family protein [Streptomyces sp. F001]RZB17009.1 gamma-glutamyl-gamma-aminobutyrate hydrolase [Streptomyces sp. F001]